MYDRMQLLQVRQTGVLVKDQSPCCRTRLVSHAQWNTTSCPQSTRTGSSIIPSSLCRAAVTNGQTDVGECWWQTEGDVKTNRKAREAITAREKPSQQTETAVLSITGSTFRWCVPLMMPSLSAPLPKPRSSSAKGLFVVYCYDPTPPVFENEGCARRTRPKLRQPIYYTGSYIVTTWSVSQYSYCGFESWLCSEQSAEQHKWNSLHIQANFLSVKV